MKPFRIKLIHYLYFSYVITNEKNSIAYLLHEASEFNVNDLLVNLHFDHCITYQHERELSWELVRKVILKSQNLIKESGVNPLCVAKGAIIWERNGQEIQSPLLLFPCSFKHNKVTKCVELSVDEEAAIVNPFVEKHLKSVYDIHQVLPKTLHELTDQLHSLGFKNINETLCELGNFHHHRYELLKELEELLTVNHYPITLEELLGMNESKVTYSDTLSEMELLPTDDDHRKAIASFEQRNIVVQGPPGTGKSQLLTNIIGKSLISQKSIVVVSEKRSALEVIVSKLKDLQLDHLSFISTPDLSTKDFLHSLRKSWTFFEEFQPSKHSSISIKKELENNLQLTLNLLNQDQLIGGVSYSSFRKLTRDIDLNKTIYLSRIPNLVLLQENESHIQTIYFKNLHTILGNCQFSLIVGGHWDQLAEHLSELTHISTEFSNQLNIHTWGDISKLMQQAIVCQLFENTLIEKHSRLLEPQSKEQKQFLKWTKKWQTLQKSLGEISNLSSWKIIPSSTEIDSLIEQFNGNYWQKRKAKKRWNQLSHLPILKAELALNQLVALNDLKQQITKIDIQLTELGVSDPSTEIPQIQTAIPLFTEQKWQDYALLSAEQKKTILGINPTIERFRILVKQYFSFDDDVHLCNYFHLLQEHFHVLIEHSNELKNLDSDCLYAIKHNSTFKDFLNNVAGSHWSNFKKNYPHLSQFELSDLTLKIEEILNAEQTEQVLFVAQINDAISKQFNSYNQLLSVPATKLTPEEKELKKRLRKGKALLVKEFSKTKSHPSLRDLFSSEAIEWIQLLLPIWLSNPSQLAKCFPLETGLFDHCVFDEASQLLLHNAVGAVYRSKRIVIAGDDQQMGPTNYFQSGSEEKISLLQQANHYLERAMLKHHYRSHDPSLIAFSNKHFYNNELTVFPSFSSEQNVLTLHTLSDGQFIDRQNKVEAQKVAQLIQQALTNQLNIGIVAFSKDQVNCIWEALSEKDKEQLEERIECNEAFLKPLEKVQGDECEHLIISLGYAFNEEGAFQLRMGPLNRTSGRNRLNVLFSRASKKIDFVCSVEASDFKLSENESINLLRDWIRFAQNCKTSAKETPVFPFGLVPIIEGNGLLFESIQDIITSANELVTIHRVLMNRGWKIHYN